MKLVSLLLYLFTTISIQVGASPVPFQSESENNDGITTSHAMTVLPRQSFPVSVAPRQSLISRTIHISSTMKIHDDETFGDDDFTRTTTLAPIILGTSAGYSRQVTFAGRAGGEIRVEVLLTLTLRPNDLSVVVSYLIKLFEGTSESTNDLDGQVEGSGVVGKDRTVEIRAKRVKNDDEGGDWADVIMSVVNAP